VPLWNFLGWYLATFIVLYVDEALEVGYERSFDALRGITLALSIMIFNVLIALGIRQWRVALSGAVITAAVVWMCLPTLKALWESQGKAEAPGV
jgi:uncharacterized membrane protein